jgi:STE24 endopeptidase
MIPLSFFLFAYLVIFVFTTAADLFLDRLNLRHLQGFRGQVPDAFKGLIDQHELNRIHRYTIDKTRFGMISTITGKAVFLWIILSGLLPWIATHMENVHFLPAGLVFFAVPGLISAVIDLPFNWYHIFVIEDRYGFNTRTMKIWVTDLAKSLLITVILGGVLLSLLFLLVVYAGKTWWLWAWFVFFAFQLLMIVLYPSVIAPWFNKFEPVRDEELAEQIRDLAAHQKIRVKGIFQMDAGKRSRHTNAYFAGLGRVKRIVLYDTLLEAHEQDEILSILAHEIGHLKKNHIKKQLMIMGAASIFLLYLASLMIHWEGMYRAFGFSQTPVYAGLFLIGVLWEPVGFFLSPLGMAVSRRFERQADRYAFKAAGRAEPLIEALKKMARDNLANLRPHPWYVRFNYSHPPLLERIRSLSDMARTVQ